jgi:O-antigen/teichoic acid export membrane protein
MDEKQVDNVNIGTEIPTLDNALKHITKGGLFILLGSVAGGIISFITRIIIIRHISESEFGILSLALVLLNLIVWLFSLGVVSGLARLISYYKAQNNLKKVEIIIRSAIWSSLCVGIGISILLLCFGNKISNIFNSVELLPVFSILVGSVPFMIFTALCIQIFLGFGISWPKIYLDPAGSSVIRFSLILIVIFLSGIFSSVMFINIVWAYFFSFLITGVMALFYTKRKISQFIKPKILGRISKEVVIFSLPLLGATIFSLIIGWADTLFIGYFRNLEEVGVYNVAFTLGNIVPYLFLASIGYIYLPMATQYFSKNMLAEVKNLYSSLSRWIFIFTIIPTFIFLLFPRQTITLFFGERYIGAAFPLVLITSGFLIQVIFGPIAVTLLALGKTKTILLVNIIGIITNISLNFFLVPIWGIVGAGYACVFSIMLVNILYFLFLYCKDKISPFSRDYLKAIFISAISILLVYFPGKYLIDISNRMLPAAVLMFLFILVVLGFISGALTENDKMLLIAIRRRVLKIR